jgi:hypothetical protein
MSSIGTIHKIADGFNRRYKVRKNTTSSVGTAHNQAIFAIPTELVRYFCSVPTVETVGYHVNRSYGTQTPILHLGILLLL